MLVTWLEELAVQETERHEYWHSSSMMLSRIATIMQRQEVCGREISTVETQEMEFSL